MEGKRNSEGLKTKRWRKRQNGEMKIDKKAKGHRNRIKNLSKERYEAITNRKNREQ